MKNAFTIILGFLISADVFGTAQIADILIYNNDTLRLYSNPLESFYNEENPRPKDFGIAGCSSTACWRGYQATWEIKDNILYLIEIADCCFWGKYVITDDVLIYLKDKLEPELLKKLRSLKGKEYWSYHFENILKKKLGRREFRKNKDIVFKASLKPSRKADLAKLFGEYYKDGKVAAFWFTGELTVPRGKRIHYVHMGYMSKYERELVFTVENGIVIELNEYENKTRKSKKDFDFKDFGLLVATSYALAVPLELVKSEDGYLSVMTDTVNCSNADKTCSIEALSKFNNERKTSATRKTLVESTIDSLTRDLSTHYEFSDKKTEKLRWGTASWADGLNKENNERLRVFTMSNINSQVTIYFKEKSIDEEGFSEKADAITYSVKLMEFGY